MEYTKMQLDIVILPEKQGENTIYSISSIQIPNVVTQGETIEEARQMLKEALELYFEEAPQEREKIIQTVKYGNSVPLISRMMV